MTPLAVSPQAWLPPASTAVSPTVEICCGVAWADCDPIPSWPAPFVPQQYAEPFEIPHVNSSPAEIRVNETPGTAVGDDPLLPQQ